MAEELEQEEIRDPKAVLEALDRAKRDAQKYREDAEALKAQLAESTNDKYKARAVKAEAKLALQEKGVRNVDRVLKHLSLDDLDYDTDGNIAGLEGRISELQNDLPELFSKKHQAGELETATNTMKAKPKTASEIQAELILGRV